MIIWKTAKKYADLSNIICNFALSFKKKKRKKKQGVSRKRPKYCFGHCWLRVKYGCFQRLESQKKDAVTNTTSVAVAVTVAVAFTSVSAAACCYRWIVSRSAKKVISLNIACSLSSLWPTSTYSKTFTYSSPLLFAYLLCLVRFDLSFFV